MQKHINSSRNAEPLLISRSDFYARLGCGRQSADKLAKAANAERRIGRRVLIFWPMVEAYLKSNAVVG